MATVGSSAAAISPRAPPHASTLSIGTAGHPVRVNHAQRLHSTKPPQGRGRGDAVSSVALRGPRLAATTSPASRPCLPLFDGRPALRPGRVPVAISLNTTRSRVLARRNSARHCAQTGTRLALRPNHARPATMRNLSCLRRREKPMNVRGRSLSTRLGSRSIPRQA